MSVGDTHGGFDPSRFSRLAALEDRNFWHKQRSNLILWSISEYAIPTGKLLEIGCGTGFVLKNIAREFPQLELYGSDLFGEGLVFCAERVPKATLVQLDALQLPYTNEFDIVGAFDVLEHIENDVGALNGIAKCLKSTGSLVLTVPQHGFLWSQSDELAHHCRRYSRQELEDKLDEAGFDVVRITSFVFLLLPLMMASRLWQRWAKPKFDVLSELEVGGLVNWTCEQIMTIERFLIRQGASLPVGGSLLVVAKPRQTATEV